MSSGIHKFINAKTESVVYEYIKGLQSRLHSALVVYGLLSPFVIYHSLYDQEFIIKEGRESIQLSEYPVQTHCVKFAP